MYLLQRSRSKYYIMYVYSTCPPKDPIGHCVLRPVRQGAIFVSVAMCPALPDQHHLSELLREILPGRRVNLFHLLTIEFYHNTI